MKKTILKLSLATILCGSIANASFFNINRTEKNDCNVEISKKINKLTLTNNFDKATHFTIFDECGNVLLDKVVSSGEKFNIVGRLKDGTIGNELFVCVGGKFYKSIKTKVSDIHIQDCIGKLVVSGLKVMPCNLSGNDNDDDSFKIGWEDGFAQGLIDGQEDACNLNPFNIINSCDNGDDYDKGWAKAYKIAYTKSFKFGCDYKNSNKKAVNGELSSLTLEATSSPRGMVLITDEFGDELYEGYVRNGQTITLVPTDNKKLFGDSITIELSGNTIATIPTKCNELNDTYGDFKVVDKECSGGSCQNKLPIPSCDTIDKVKDGAACAASKARGAACDVKEKADCASSKLKDRACDTVSKVKDGAACAGSKAKGTIWKTSKKFKNGLACAASKAKDSACDVKEKADCASSKLKDRACDTVGKVKDGAACAGSKAKGTIWKTSKKFKNGLACAASKAKDSACDIKEKADCASSKLKDRACDTVSKVKDGAACAGSKAKGTIWKTSKKFKNGLACAASKAKDSACDVKEKADCASSKLKDRACDTVSKVKDGAACAGSKAKKNFKRFAFKCKSN